MRLIQVKKEKKDVKPVYILILKCIETSSIQPSLWNIEINFVSWIQTTFSYLY